MVPPHVKCLEDAIEGIIGAAQKGDWEGPELPGTVGAAIAHARVVRDMERRRRGFPPFHFSARHGDFDDAA